MLLGMSCCSLGVKGSIGSHSSFSQSFEEMEGLMRQLLGKASRQCITACRLRRRLNGIILPSLSTIQCIEGHEGLVGRLTDMHHFTVSRGRHDVSLVHRTIAGRVW